MSSADTSGTAEHVSGLWLPNRPGNPKDLVVVHGSGSHGEIVQAHMLTDERLVVGVGRGAFPWETGQLGTPLEAPYPAGTYDDFDAWNARFVERKTGVKTADVLAELDAAHRAFVAAAAGLPDRHFAPGSAARESFEGAGAGHYREHAAQIREWRQRTAP